MNSYFVSGCVFDSDSSNKTESKDKGTYTLIVDPLTVESYPTGGGLFIITLEPSDDFEGDVNITIEANPALNAQITTEKLSLKNRVAEIEIHPDSTVTSRTDTLKVLFEHNNKTKPIILTVTICIQWGLETMPCPSWHSEFLQWIKTEHQEFSIEGGEDWFGWFKYPCLEGVGVWMYINQKWEITVVIEVFPPFKKWFLLRKRGEVIPKLCAREYPDNTFIEYPIEVWEELYRH